MKSIPLGNPNLGLFAVIDDEDFERINRYKWDIIRAPYTMYARRRIQINLKRTTILMHREIMNADDGVLIDHKNGNGLCNSKTNLRVVTHAQNMQNRQLDRRNQSGCTGVCWYPQKNKWQVSIMAEGKRKHLGHFANLEDAIAARRAAEAKYYGDFARQPSKIAA